MNLKRMRVKTVKRYIVAGVLLEYMTCSLYADALSFGVVGSPIDLSANVSESILPGGTVFHESKPLLGTTPDPKQSAELLHLSPKGVNGSGRSTSITDAFASSLAESDGNGGVGVSQLLFGEPGAPGENIVRQLVAQSLWTQTFVYTGIPAVDIKLHLQIPSLEVGLIGVAPRRTGPSSTETAEARANVDTIITHADGTFSKGGSFEFGVHAFERQLIFKPGDFANFADVKFLGVNDNALPLFNSFRDNGSDSDPRFAIDSVSTDVKLGTLHTGDTLAYVYTLTAEGTTHGFEHGYVAFLGDPFGVDTVAGNLGVTVSASAVPEPGTGVLMMLGCAGLVVWRKRLAYSRRGVRPEVATPCEGAKAEIRRPSPSGATQMFPP